MSDFVRAQAVVRERDAVGRKKMYKKTGALISDSCPSFRIVYMCNFHTYIFHTISLFQLTAHHRKQQFNKSGNSRSGNLICISLTFQSAEKDVRIRGKLIFRKFIL